MDRNAKTNVIACEQWASSYRDHASIVLACTSGDPEACQLTAVDGEQSRITLDLYDALCRQGSAAMCEGAARMLAEEPRIGSRDKAATRYFVRALTLYGAGCDNGAGKCCTSAGRLHHEGVNVTRDWIAAKRFFVKACTQEDSEGCEQLGALLSVVGAYPKLREWAFLRAGRVRGKTCDRGKEPSYCVRAAENYLALTKDRSDRRVRHLVNVAIEAYDRRCSARDAIACSNLSELYFEGALVAADQQKASEYSKRAVELFNSHGASGESVDTPTP